VKVQAAFTQVSGYRQAERACSNDRDIGRNSHDSSFPYDGQYR
jgi:hypothetical protein